MGHPINASNRMAVPNEIEVVLKTGQKAKIRSVEPSDFPVLGQIYAETYTKTPGVKEHWEPQDAERMLSTINKFPNRVGIVAVIDEKIVGGSFGHCLPWQDKSRVFKELETFVLPDYQKTGIGTHLREERRHRAEVWFHPTSSELVTFSKLPHPKKWYQRLGFKTEDELEIMVADAEEEKRNLQREVASVVASGEKMR